MRKAVLFPIPLRWFVRDVRVGKCPRIRAERKGRGKGLLLDHAGM